MTDSRRVALKLALAAAPPLVLLLSLQVFGSELHQLVQRMRARATITSEAGHFYFQAPVNDPRREPLERWAENFLEQTYREQTLALGISRREWPAGVTIELGDAAEAPAADRCRDEVKPQARRIEVRAAPDTDLETLKRRLSHRLVHAILHYRSPEAGWSPWIEEGLAEVLESSRPNSVTLDLGRISNASIPAPPSIDSIVGLRRDQLGPDERDRCYALVWFLRYGSGQRHAERLRRLLDADARPGPLAPEDLAPLAELDEEWRSWLRRPDFSPPEPPSRNGE